MPQPAVGSLIERLLLGGKAECDGDDEGSADGNRSQAGEEGSGCMPDIASWATHPSAKRVAAVPKRVAALPKRAIMPLARGDGLWPTHAPAELALPLKAKCIGAVPARVVPAHWAAAAVGQNGGLRSRPPPKAGPSTAGSLQGARSRSPRREAGDFWCSPEVQTWQDPDGCGAVRFRATLVDPALRRSSSRGGADVCFPIAFFFTGLGDKAADAVIAKYEEWAAVAPEPFLLVAPERPAGSWWFIDSDSHWGWVEGGLDGELLGMFGRWMADVVALPGVDAGRVGIFGFSAGAYATVELLASGCLGFSGVGLGGVHGHGQPDLSDIPAKRARGVVEKFAAFLERLAQHGGAPWIEATHAPGDQQSRWEDASQIVAVLSQRQLELDLPEVSVRVLDPDEQDSMPGGRRNRAQHDYSKAAFLRSDFLMALFGGPAPQASAVQLPKPLLAPRVTIPETLLEVSEFTTSCEGPGWEDNAFELFATHGFVVVEGVLKLHQYAAVLRDCERVAGKMVGPERRGNRGPGRYSFGIASSTGSMLHEPSFTRHLLDHGSTVLRPLLERIFEGGERPGFLCLSSGGDFVLDRVPTHQDLHADIQVTKAHNLHLPPPLLSVNFCVQAITELNGPMRIVPGTQQGSSALPEKEPDEWRQSRLCPLPAGAAILRDVRTLHGGTPNLSDRARYLPSIEYVSADFRAMGRRDKFPPRRCLPGKLFQRLPPDVQELCEELVVPDEQLLRVDYTRR